MNDVKVDSPDHARLFGIASEQGGYFTTSQADECGFSRALLAHHAREGGRFVHIQRGLYRFRQYPSSPREDVLIAWLAVGRDTAVVSHQSALELHGLSDVIPMAVHLTIPRSKRYLKAPAEVQLHTTTRELAAADVVLREGIRLTSPVRSIIDSAESGVAPEQIIAAVREAIDRGMATPTQLKAAAQDCGGRVQRLVRQALQGTDQR